MVVVKISRNSFRKKAEVRKASAQARAASFHPFPAPVGS